jgi:CubicO group peptidase (beta-lactamase class C family)
VPQIVTGTALPRVLQERIFGPLDLDMVLDPVGDIPGKAISYVEDARGPQVTDWPWEQIGDGSIQTTPSELVRWADNYRTGKVGGEKLLDAQLSGAVKENIGYQGLGLGSEFDYGAGIEIARDGTVLHTGSWEGFQSVLEVSPDRHTALAVTCNSPTGAPLVLTADLRKIWT